jgi:D-lactate dehydrogenase
MKIGVFSVKKYDREFLSAANGSRHELRFFELHLNEESAGLAAGFEAVCVFVNDQVNAAVIARLHSLGVWPMALRCAGYNNRSEEAGFSLHLDEIEGEWKAELVL